MNPYGYSGLSSVPMGLKRRNGKGKKAVHRGLDVGRRALKKAINQNRRSTQKIRKGSFY